MNDEIDYGDLLARIQGGDSQAEAALIAHFLRWLNLLLFLQTRDRELSEGATQDALIVLLEKARAGRIEKPASLRAFVRSVGVRKVLERIRKRDRRNTVADTDLVEAAMAENESLLARVQSEQLQACIDDLLSELPPRDRDVLLRRHYYDEAPGASADALDVSRDHFYRVLYRAHVRLGELLERDGSGPSILPALVAFAPILQLLVLGHTQSSLAVEPGDLPATRHYHHGAPVCGPGSERRLTMTASD